VYVEEVTDQSTACKREYEIKQFSRQAKEALIKQEL
jgi:predicted GIY-YIG superfamily endonuclease